MKDKSHERTYLLDLLSDFAVASDSNVDKLIQTIQARYVVLLRHTVDFAELLSRPEVNGVWPAVILPRMIHEFLYRGILSNAGQYRLSDEPGNGNVLFGSEQEFAGISPTQIEAEITGIFGLLRPSWDDPKRQAAEFYQRFVHIHLFYDANGRIGRAIVTAYFELHGLFMNWEAMEHNATWLRRLNHCHRRYGGPDYETYLHYHVEHWRKYIFAKGDIYFDDDLGQGI